MSNKSLNKIENQKHIVDYLIKKYKQNTKPNNQEVYKIASKTKFTCQQIKKWFSDERFKRNRDRCFPEKTLNFLIQEFEKQRYLSPDKIHLFANKLNLTYKQVLRWFNRRRCKNGFTKLNDKKGIFIYNKIELFIKKIKYILIEKNNHTIELVCDEYVLKNIFPNNNIFILTKK